MTSSPARPRSRIPKPLRHLLNLEALIGAAFIATAFAIAYEEPLTSRFFSVEPQGLGTQYFAYEYGDENEGGTSKPVASAPLDWTCNLTRAYQFGYCGFGLQFDLDEGKTFDFSKFDRVTIRLRYERRAEFLRMVLKDRDPRLRGADGRAVEKVNQTTVTVVSGEQEVTIPLADFTVAEWWKDQLNATGEMANPGFRHVTALEFLTGTDAYPGEHRLKIHEITFQRKLISTEAWYGAIIAVWLALMSGFLLQRRRHTKLLRSELRQRLRTTLDTIPQMVWALDEKGRVHFNERWEQFTGVPLGKDPKVDFFQLVHPEERQRAIDEWQRCLASGDSFDIEYRLTHVSGLYRWVLARAVPARDERGTITGWYGTCTDVHDRVLAQQALKDSIASERRKADELKWASEHDALTSLPNRRAFQARLAAATLRAMQSGRKLGLLLLDMDHFKHTNDSLGHWAGDELLQAVAERLKDTLRKDDFVARIGGDEFAVILEPVRSEDDLLALGDKMFEAIRLPLRVATRQINPAASIGGAMFPADAETANDLFKAADTALYALKRSGRGGLRLFHRTMLEEVEQAASQLGRARQAISEQSLFPVYQPKVDLTDGSVTGFEALLRWTHPVKGLQFPASLDEAFRDYELAARMGELMQRQVARDIRRWMDSGIAFGRIAINASPAEFLRDDYAERLSTVLMEAGVPPQALEVEVTEQAFIDRGGECVARALTGLRAAGISIALDDFGTGYSSLSHLRDFPVDVVKIDQSFVQQMTNDPEIASIVTAVVSLAESLDIAVVAEGVELPSQRELLSVMGCRFAQGHLFSAAVDAAEVPALLSLPRAA